MFHVVKGYAENNYSFFSSHSANYTALATFFILLVRHRLMTAAMVCLALINMWTRLYLGQHYLSDICVGMMWGIVSGYIGWRVYKKYSHQESLVTELAPTGFLLRDIYISAAVFMCTLILVVLL
jgi:undecaprenyl-diphosphatase